MPLAYLSAWKCSLILKKVKGNTHTKIQIKEKITLPNKSYLCQSLAQQSATLR